MAPSRGTNVDRPLCAQADLDPDSVVIPDSENTVAAPHVPVPSSPRIYPRAWVRMPSAELWGSKMS